jgi:polysaccharide biosynthesis/export protein
MSIRSVCLISAIAGITLVAPYARAMSPAGTGQQATASPLPSTKMSSGKPGGFARDEDASANYRIAVGDLIDIRVLGEPDMNASVRVSNTGDLRVPYIVDDIRAKCLTERQLAGAIAEKLKKILRFPEVSVTVTEYSGGSVAVMGAVRSQGRYQLPRQMGVLELLINAGGVNEQAGRFARLIHMTAPSTDPCAEPDVALTTPVAATEADTPVATLTMESVDLKKLFNGDLNENRIVRAGDILMIPNADVVFLAGALLRPGQMTLRDGLTLSQAVAMAGGTTDIAKTDEVHITRVDANGQQQDIVVNLKDLKKNKGTDPVLLANDIVEVPDSSGKKFRQGFVQTLINGAVSLPFRAARGGW